MPHRGNVRIDCPLAARCPIVGPEPREATAAELPAWLTPDLLCDREWEVAVLLIRGETCKAVGAALAISARTVEAYRAHILRTLGVRGIGGLALLALLWGRIDPVPDVRPTPSRKARVQPRRSTLPRPRRPRVS